jgi:hypothetical protein
MTALICPLCKKSLNMGLWDNHTQRFYCVQCVPPLPEGERGESSVWTSRVSHKNNRRIGTTEGLSDEQPEKWRVSNRRCGDAATCLGWSSIS